MLGGSDKRALYLRQCNSSVTLILPQTAYPRVLFKYFFSGRCLSLISGLVQCVSLWSKTCKGHMNKSHDLRWSARQMRQIFQIIFLISIIWRKKLIFHPVKWNLFLLYRQFNSTTWQYSSVGNESVNTSILFYFFDVIQL